jgi:hypothetical protein
VISGRRWLALLLLTAVEALAGVVLALTWVALVLAFTVVVLAAVAH